MLRNELVARLEQAGDVTDERVKAALHSVPRHSFVAPGTSLEEAYANQPLPIGCAQTILQPAVVALMSEALELKGTERVLEIGTGSGYQAAIPSALAAQVYSVEYFAELAEKAAAILARLGCSNVQVRHGDREGWPQQAPFDRILATEASPALPSPWLEQLDDGGVLVAPVAMIGDKGCSPTARTARARRSTTSAGPRSCLCSEADAARGRKEALDVPIR